MQVTIGGNRVGSGKKMRTELNNYGRSTHNLSKKWASSLGSGILYPCYKRICTRGDNFTIDINADCRTIPTKGPLFGSYKMQIDFYQVPIRLYQGILHNNPVDIGLKMNQVKLPKLQIYDTRNWNPEEITKSGFSNSCLLKYLGLSGIGISNANGEHTITRYINAIPALAYYDIFKNYYANKQEENAWVITGDKHDFSGITLDHAFKKTSAGGTWTQLSEADDEVFFDSVNEYQGGKWEYLNSYGDVLWQFPIIVNCFAVSDQTAKSLEMTWQEFNNYMVKDPNNYVNNYVKDGGMYVIRNVGMTISLIIDNIFYKVVSIQAQSPSDEYESIDKLKLTPFELSNIDKMRYDILSSNTLGDTFIIDDSANLPYVTLTESCNNGETRNILPLNGLVVKTYQNDIFNNWLNSEWIEGPNGINELTKVAVVNNAFSMDALSFAKKRYNMLNRLVVAGPTYNDWENVVYEETFNRCVETPIWVGGMSKEIVFDEVVQTAPAEGDALGTLGGRGRALAGSEKGGRLNIKCDEACYIIGIVSLTPRIFYTQGNDFDMTELDSLDDLHKPAMDGIGFQDLVGERLAWFDTRIIQDSDVIYHRSKIGKLPAWIEYMTDVDTAYGDFAETEGKGYMILQRNYEFDQDEGVIKDATTYIDPQKYNYAFAYNELEAQNFWVEIAFTITARRLMSARLIPNV